jgi:uncharacterized protein (DUF1778 family)
MPPKKKVVLNQVSIRLSQDEKDMLRAAALAAGRGSISNEVRYRLFVAPGVK